MSWSIFAHEREPQSKDRVFSGLNLLQIVYVHKKFNIVPQSHKKFRFTNA